MLTAEEALVGWPFVARRYGIELPASESAVRAALAFAAGLVSDPRDEPAAVFFAFASFRRAFPGAWRPMAMLLMHSQARASGVRVTASTPELAALCLDVMHRRVDFPAVRAWFLERTTYPS